ncbi:hypothetical protein L596_028353 [Steinernema carpocapsae]|uniref:C2H2-type domain-containing protein n=1 Tax=Steinernema carpocapsae TaxID=34508 RepID=A0A4U5LY85_STECR|nr:hypothetical protein L596_028353 [Steinernema carpocapsae]
MSFSTPQPFGSPGQFQNLFMYMRNIPLAIPQLSPDQISQFSKLTALRAPDSSPESLKSSHSSPSETPRRRKKTAATFCKLCRKDVSSPGKKNQGPLRHVRQAHMNGERVYECRFCNFAAHYDRTHIITHIRRHHPQEKANKDNVIDHTREFEPKTKQLINECFPKSTESTPSPNTSGFMIDNLISSD